MIDYKEPPKVEEEPEPIYQLIIIFIGFCVFGLLAFLPVLVEFTDQIYK